MSTPTRPAPTYILPSYDITISKLNNPP